MDLRDDAPLLFTQLARIVARQPPPSSIRAFYFGLFERQIDGSGASEPALYVSGSTRSPDEPDWMGWDEDSWLPEGRYFALPHLAATDPADWESIEEAVANVIRIDQGRVDALLNPDGGMRPLAVGWDDGEPRLL